VRSGEGGEPLASRFGIARAGREVIVNDGTPLPGCCHACREPITARQKSVTFEGPNLLFPELGDDSAVFHLREMCRWAARRYDETWTKAQPGRRQKFEGWFSGEALLVLIETADNHPEDQPDATARRGDQPDS
jgi:hypothetical protein